MWRRSRKWAAITGPIKSPAGTPCWIVDPLDGTVNYLHGLPWYAVSIAAVLDGVVCAGAVVEPSSGRVWSAARALGASLDGSPLRVSATERVDLAVVATGFSYRPERRERQARLFAGLLVTRPDWGIVAVAVWTMLSLVVHLVRLFQAMAAAARGQRIVSWLA